ncbi:MAG: Zn-dependent hydrolase [Terrimicrobiaceae bacterium]|nr:Zn-dependent hydrolase [Terrimicrobiaceae bacterium]
MDYDSAAAVLQARIRQLAKITDEPGRVTRTFLSTAMLKANEKVAQWMGEVGFSTGVDTVGNLHGWLEAAPDAPVLLTGSHLDTVRNAGPYDGVLGVLLPIAAVELLRASDWRPEFSVLCLGFADEEGVRFQAGCIGSKGLLGRLSAAEMALRDEDELTLEEALAAQNEGPFRPPPLPRAPLGYVEVHIEQGPELERLGSAVAVVTGINAQNRMRVCFRGEAGHAGTVPMGSRRDAFAGLADFGVFAERFAKTTRGLVATIGCVELRPGVGNVIPSEVEFSVDVRHPSSAQLESACAALHREALRICVARALECEWTSVDAMNAVEFGSNLTTALGNAILATGNPLVRLRSGAGHDAMVMTEFCEAAMLFVRCRRGLSHHPDEFVSPTDLAEALKVYCEFLKRLTP